MNDSHVNDDPASSATVPVAQSSDACDKSSRLRWTAYLWDTLDKSPEEQRFMFKLDAAILTMGSLGYFIKNFDQININNAFVSGMKEDLGLNGNELNYMQTCWTVGYVIGQIPSNLLLTRIRPSLWIPSCEVTWSVLTILMATCSSVQQIYVLRFFIGLAESTFYPGMQYIIGSWYRKSELGKRSCIFHASSALGSMFSAYLMAAVYHLDGVSGFKGWQWLFIINTVISLPIALSGFFFLPDVPEITRAWYFTPDEIVLAQKRMQADGRANRAPYTLSKVKKIFSSWHIYLLTLLYILYINGGVAGQPAFAIWLKQQGYTVAQINLYPTLTTIVQIITTIIYAWTSDIVLRGERWPPILFSGVMIIIVHTSLTIWDIPTAWKWACFILSGCSGGISGLIYAWMHEICAEDNEERALVAASMNEVASTVLAWLPLLIWRQVDAPEYPRGYPTSIGIAVAMMVTAMAIRHLQRRDVARRSGLQLHTYTKSYTKSDLPSPPLIKSQTTISATQQPKPTLKAPNSSTISRYGSFNPPTASTDPPH
ncbi:major facilitator superfamily domain-containing protein [Aspergillus avenaceus]|uniref:Major facilitator superfamily domain-containing protein n=1 Tax=Aspergillus avenaceus TaxID=36643 RepID=A0A5N6TN38_ASPAV|nr:major facilitator superfamily domain-containing protein [Aspergillus avenaceus]